MDMGPRWATYRFFGQGGEQIGAMMNEAPQVAGSAWTIYFRVPDIDAAAERVKAGGGQVLMGPIEVPGGELRRSGRRPPGRDLRRWFGRAKAKERDDDQQQAHHLPVVRPWRGPQGGRILRRDLSRQPCRPGARRRRPTIPAASRATS